MSEKQNYLDSLEEIKTVSNDVVKFCYMPIGMFIHECKITAGNATKDFAVLTPLGLKQEQLDRLIVFTGALVTAEVNWQNEATVREEAQATWKANAPAMHELIDELYDNMRFAYRNDERLLGVLENINEGDSNADAVMDLARLGTLGKDNQEPLLNIGFDVALCDTALSESERMSALLAEVNGNLYVDDENKVIRDKTYTIVKSLIDEIRAYGKFAFRKDDEHARLYASKYQRDQKAEYRRTKKQNELNVEQA